MADVNELKPRSIVIRDETSVAPDSFGQSNTIVTFFVGSHGPFRLVYKKDQATSTKINADIEHQVVELRRITERSY